LVSSNAWTDEQGRVWSIRLEDGMLCCIMYI
jgi:hypothetical protein